MKNNKEYQEKFDNEKEINTEQEDFDEEYDEEQEDSEDYDDSDEEEDEYAELAPSSILGYIRFMRDKENKKYTFSDMPKIFKSKILKHLLLAVLAIGLGLAMLVVYKTFIALIIGLLIGVLAFRDRGTAKTGMTTEEVANAVLPSTVLIYSSSSARSEMCSRSESQAFMYLRICRIPMMLSMVPS